MCLFPLFLIYVSSLTLVCDKAALKLKSRVCNVISKQPCWCGEKGQIKHKLATFYAKGESAKDSKTTTMSLIGSVNYEIYYGQS